MLFNTLSYAKFFAVVFGVSWLLVRPRMALFLPWFGLVAFTLTTPDRNSVLGAAVALLGTVVLYRRGAQAPALRVPAASAAEEAALWLEGSGVSAARGVSWPEAVCATLLSVVPFAAASTRALSVSKFAAASALLIGIGLLSWLMTARRVRLLFILGASYVFYAHWDWHFLPLIWASSTIDWLLGNAIAKAAAPRTRRLWLIVTVIVNLGVLAVFKYFNFGVDAASSALRALGYQPPEMVLELALPIGISFFTFESMSYVIDVYRKDIEPHPSYLEYLTFVAFFPHLVAGPIVRPRDLLPQLAGAARFSAALGSEALFLIATGLLKKVAIGDYLALNLVDRVFDAPAQYSALECYAAVVGYAVQIYCDFSGYTDVAIGSALLLGIRFPANFNAPYKAHNIVDFWRRWHISLSTWLRDYLYVPLGGNRKGTFRTYVNLLLTMLLGGLWHGASWTFVVWGGIHGVALAMTRAWQQRRARHGAPPPGATSPLAVLATFHLVCFGWIFFRARSFHDAKALFRELATLTTHHTNLDWPVILVLSLGLLTHWMPERWYRGLSVGFQALPAAGQGMLLFAAGWLVRQMSSADAVPFVYFQF